jgi:hypothetical protein
VRKLLALVSVVALLLIAGDFVTKKAAEGQIARKASSSSGPDARGSASISSFPFVGRLLATGSVPRINVRVDRALAGGVIVAWVDVELHGVRLNKHRFPSARKAEITRISSGTLTLALDSAALSALAKTSVQVANGQIDIALAGRTVQATPSVDGQGELRLKVDPLPSLPLRLPSSKMIPCSATRVQVERDLVKLVCPFNKVPPALLRAAQITV